MEEETRFFKQAEALLAEIAREEKVRKSPEYYFS